MTSSLITALQRSYLTSILSGREPRLSLADIQPDRRKQSKLARELMSQGLIKPNVPEQSYPYLITERVLEALPEVCLNLCEA